MHYVLYFSIALHYIVCCHLATATGLSTTSTGAQSVSALSSIINDPSKTGMLQPHEFNTEVKMPVKRFMVNNTSGDEANSVQRSCMMESNDRDAQRNQNGIDSLEEDKHIVNEYVDGKYNPNIRHFDADAQVILQEVNDVSLKYIHAFTILLSMYMEDNQCDIKASDQLKLSFVKEMTNDLHLFSLSYNKLFVDPYILEYVPKLQSKTNFDEFKKLIPPKLTNETDDGSILSMVNEADPVAEHLKKFLPTFVDGCLNDSFVSDPENWLIDVKNQIHILLKENYGDTSSALNIIRNEAFSYMGSFLNSNPAYNPDENMPPQL